jgi:hypothetical protein
MKAYTGQLFYQFSPYEEWKNHQNKQDSSSKSENYNKQDSSSKSKYYKVKTHSTTNLEGLYYHAWKTYMHPLLLSPIVCQSYI